MKPFAVAFVLIAIAASAQETIPPEIRAQAARLDVAMRFAEDYCREVDSFTSENPPAVLSADSTSRAWHRQPSTSSSDNPAFMPTAFVWTQADHIVAVQYWTPALGMRFEPVSYCFRNDGTLARVSIVPRLSRDRAQASLLKTFAVGQQWFFDETGRRIAVEINQQDPAPLKSETTEYVYPDVRLFKRVRDLPFADVMREPAGPMTKVAQPSR
jgi:hypothetical protein